MTKPKSNFFHNLMKQFKFLTDKDPSQEEDFDSIAAQEQKLFNFETLASSTKHFHISNKLGEGGFGPVYKGNLEDGREIAVKKLSHSSRQGKKEFMNESKLLARVQHKNIVSLLGYCAHGVEQLLVYEYLPRQSLDKFLFNSKRKEELDWKKRYDVIVGVAKGLLYLHEDCHITIIHRDIKASNILLDDKWVPKIADFGMARLFRQDETHVNTRVAGTNGYMAPEYVMHGNLSAKADVFSFGVVVLELISGQKNSSFSQDSEASCLLEWVWKLYKRGRSLEIVDPTLAPLGEFIEQIKMCIQIGLLCCQSDPTRRPLMKRVVVMLSKKPGSLEEPERPGYLGSRYRRTTRSSRPGSSPISSHRPTASSSNAGSSGGSSSNTYVSTFNTSSATTSTTATATSTLPRRHGKEPIQ